jgi:hypothetical protein
MTNVERQMTKENRMTKHEARNGAPPVLSSFVLRHSFVIWLSTFGFSRLGLLTGREASGILKSQEWQGQRH